MAAKDYLPTFKLKLVRLPPADIFVCKTRILANSFNFSVKTENETFFLQEKEFFHSRETWSVDV